MAKDIFSFKQFDIKHAFSTMRVGTDAVLLGAWAKPSVLALGETLKVLDIGSGCGLISLMIAQRFSNAQVKGIDIDVLSVDEATYNASNSPFVTRITFEQSDVRDYSTNPKHPQYDFILCNPPYYTEDTLPPDQRRSAARNTHHLSFAELLKSVSQLLTSTGVFSVIIPMQARDEFISEAMKNSLYLRRECRVQTTLSKTPKRVLLEFDLQISNNVEIQSLVLLDSNGARSEEYASLCSDFYLY